MKISVSIVKTYEKHDVRKKKRHVRKSNNGIMYKRAARLTVGEEFYGEVYHSHKQPQKVYKKLYHRSPSSNE